MIQKYRKELLRKAATLSVHDARKGENNFMQSKIGFLGMGIMGPAMAKNILKAGYEFNGL